MGAAIFVLWFVCMLIVYDLKYRILYIFNPEESRRQFTRQMPKFAQDVFTVVQTLTPFRMLVENELEPALPESILIVSNHQSLADIPAIYCGLPNHCLKFIAKNQLRRGIPLISFGLRMGMHSSISRGGNFAGTYAELKKLSRLTTKNACPVVFPEGTRSRNGEVLRFHSAAFRLILASTDIPVVSVAVAGGYKIGRLLQLFTRLKEVIYHVKVLNIYPHPNGKREALELLSTIRTEIVDQLHQWREETS